MFGEHVIPGRLISLSTSGNQGRIYTYCSCAKSISTDRSMEPKVGIRLKHGLRDNFTELVVVCCKCLADDWG